jgi:Cu(I)/Ag(I) efflux system membrane fusion protein
MIMNHHQLWAALQIFPNEQALVKKNDRVNIIPESDTGATIHGKIDFIEPFFRQNSKTLTARVYFDNMNMLPVGSHVTAEVYSAGVNGLWLPSSAVVSLGENEIVFTKQNGGFIAHKVNTGMHINDNIQISSGLSSNDTVAANAQYLIDSESFIKTNK